MNMRQLTIAAVTLSLSLSLAGFSSAALAQDKSLDGISTNADGSYVTSTAGVNPTANGGGGTIVYGDITTGPGHTVIGPPSVVQTSPPPEPVPAVEPAPAPAPEPAPVDTAVATTTDIDADNMADELEWDLGLDPNNADTDGDGVADGDEINIYGTDAVVWDSDGDGISDGEELFGIMTDPLVWDDFSGESSESVAQEAADAVQPYQESSTVESAPQGTTETLTATDGDASALGSGDASAAPGTVTRDGKTPSILGPDGNYNVVETAPANVTISGDTEVLSPPINAPADTSTTTCSSYGSWYDAQVAYEAAGLTAADPGLVAALDPDHDGIACEEGM